MILRLLTSSIRPRLPSFTAGTLLSPLRSAPVSSCSNPISWFSKTAGRRLATQVGAKSPPGRIYDVSTNVVKDVMLFKYDNPKFFRMLNIFAISQFLFWGYLTHFAYTTLKDAPVPETEHPEELAWYQKINLGENKYRNGIAIMSFFIGYGILFASWMFTLRSVRFLILRKGGAQVSVVTYGPFGRNRIMDVPVRCISAQESREAARVTIPIKIKDRSFFYVLDKRGEFFNNRLYDYTVGMRRKLD
ncbi:transmembrane protein 223 [Culex quinquefasciatus]|uniref:transmembrane protein 223 n=1 Tax=Culex quinquefasciatus TaxID=7176 RepID=UPI0018E3AFA1|nr:transmembrane protein 223 [Culex quinquefasciatus]